jgi:hypothetical protein
MAKISQFDGTLVRVGNEVKRFDRGAEVPDYADKDHVRLLEERGMVADGEPFTGLTHVTTGPVAFDVDEDADEHAAKERAGGNRRRT